MCNGNINCYIGVTALVIMIRLSSAQNVDTQAAKSTPDDDKLMTCQDRLWRHLSMAYPYNTPPFVGQHYTVNVTITMMLIALLDLIDNRQQMLTIVAAYANWFDPRLTWNPEDFGNCSDLNLPGTSIWIPDVSIANADGDNSAIFPSSLRVLIFANGTVELYTVITSTTSCRLDLTFFPFDTQICFIHIEGMSLYTHRLVLMPDPKRTLDTSHYMQNGEWWLNSVNVSAGDRFGSSNIRYGLVLKRKPLFYVVNIAAPIAALSMMATGVFWLPAEVGEKMGLSTVIFLSFTMFSLVINENLPSSSDSLPLLGLYGFVSFLISGFAVLASIFVVHIHCMPADSKPSPSLVRFIRCIAPVVYWPCGCCERSVERRRRTERYMQHIERPNGIVAGVALLTNSPPFEHMAVAAVNWTLCARVLDRFFFWFFFWTNCFVAFVILYILPSSTGVAAAQPTELGGHR